MEFVEGKGNSAGGEERAVIDLTAKWGFRAARMVTVIFDIDGTLIEWPTATRELRPFAAQVIPMLQGLGHEVYFWSGGGESNAWDVARRMGFPSDRCFDKPPWNEPFRLPPGCPEPDMVVDDHDEETVLGYWGGILVERFELSRKMTDTEMLRVFKQVMKGEYDVVGEV